MEQYLEYIKSGLNIKWEKKQLLFQKFATIILGLIFGIVPGVILRGYWLAIGILMVTISVISSVVCFKLLKKKMIIRTYLVFQAILCIDWMLQFILCEILFYTMCYGLNKYLLLLFLPLIIPVGIGIFNSIRLRKGSYKKNSAIGIVTVGSFNSVGIIGMLFAKQYFKNISQGFTVLLIISCFSVVTSVFSIGLLSIQKLYYLSKIEKTGRQRDGSLVS